MYCNCLLVRWLSCSRSIAPLPSSWLDNPTGVAVDASGNIYIADYSSNRIREVNTSGIISTVAGNGTLGSFASGDDGDPATSSQLNNPCGVAVDGSGNLYIANRGNNLILKVNTLGAMSVFAGGGTGLGDGYPATVAMIIDPQGVAVDAIGNVYVGETGRVRKINTSGIITTVAGNGTTGSYSGDGGSATSAQLIWGGDIAIDGTGNLYISDQSRIRSVNTSGIITTIAGNGIFGYTGDGGTATNANLGYSNSGPNFGYGVATHGGNLYIAEPGYSVYSSEYESHIRMVNSTGIITTVVTNIGDNGAATNAALYNPNSVAVDNSGNVYIADKKENRVRKVSTSGIITTIAGKDSAGYSGDGGAATAAKLSAWGVTVDHIGNIFIADYVNYVVRKVNPTGIITTIAGNGITGYSGDGSAATSARLSGPLALAVDNSDNLFITDAPNHVIRKVNSAGIISTYAGSGSAFFSGDSGPATMAGLASPGGIAIDNIGNLYVADDGALRKVNTSGTITTIAGSEGYPGGTGDYGPATSAYTAAIAVAVDSIGNIYIADWGNNRVREIIPSGIILPVTASFGSLLGDGGPAIDAMVASPTGIATDNSGNVYISDLGFNNRVRKIGSGLVTPITSTTTMAVCTGSTIALSDATTGGTWSSSNVSIATVATGIGVVTGVVSGTVIISYTVSGSFVTTTVTVNPLPSAGSIIGSPSVCTGSTSSLSDVVSGGVWHSSSTSVATVTASGVVTGVALGSAIISYGVSININK